MAEPLASPKILKRFIAAELQRMRKAAGKERAEAAKRLGLRTATTIVHHESARNLPKPAELEILLGFYGLPERIELFRELMDAIHRNKDWWAPHTGAFPAWFDLFLGLESVAATIESYDAAVVPGLLQTPAYAEAVMRAGQPNLAEDEVRARVELRTARQQVLHREPEPPQVWSVLDEAVLHRVPADPRTTRDQLEHLLAAAELPHVELQVIPFGAGLHPGLYGTYTVLGFDHDMLGGSVVYADGQPRGVYHEAEAVVGSYATTLNRLRVMAADQKHSRAIIRARIDALTKECV